MDLVHYDVVIRGSPSGAMHCAFCTRQNVVMPPLSHVKRPDGFVLGVSQDLAVSQTGFNIASFNHFLVLLYYNKIRK